jgi:pSer/pThr/pTyr-binding forkhead associated (FHA) protein
VSRKHAKIVFEDGEWKIVDLSSSNGTFVLREDFERVDDAVLEDGTEIALGNARFVFRLATA